MVGTVVEEVSREASAPGLALPSPLPPSTGGWVLWRFESGAASLDGVSGGLFVILLHGMHTARVSEPTIKFFARLLAEHHDGYRSVGRRKEHGGMDEREGRGVMASKEGGQLATSMPVW